MEEEELTQEDMQKLAQLVTTATQQEGKDNVHSFLKKVVEEKDTTKLGFLDEEELGKPTFPLRTSKELELFARDIADMPYFADYFKKEAEITTSTSLSKGAKLITLAVIQKREVADMTPKAKKKKGWFNKKESSEETQ